ncbi:MAG TPA: SdrD B-like domain-containing protein [Miltoncostaeaceae bacterium]|nr:SdrD B-like domain-containing protein [Miltoncostaeaceae bacterium]
MRRGPLGGWRRIGLLALVIALAVSAAAAAAGISLDRSPSPPQAIQRGAGTENVSFTITYTSVAESWALRFSDPAGAVVQQQVVPAPRAPSPIVQVGAYSPPANAPVGRYRASVDYNAVGGLEASALVVFDVADQLGTLQIVKFEDINGNGSRDPGEPGVPGWQFTLVNPQGNGSAVQTGADGTITIPSVPAGTWTITEATDPLWAPITPVSGQVTVPAGAVGQFIAGNARPAPITGTVFIDTNRNGRLDAGEVGRSGVRLVLTGTRPGGITVIQRETLSGADGSYSFPDLLPGSYVVSVAVPGGLTPTSPRQITGIPIRSGIGSPNNNFGLISGTGGQTQGGPTPDIGITKTAPANARAGSVFEYKITVRNRSAFAATNVEVTDLVPAQLTLVSIPSGATIRNGVVTWRVGTLAGGASKTLTMDVRVNANVTGDIVNAANVTADNLPPRRDTARTEVVGPRPVARTGGVTG